MIKQLVICICLICFPVISLAALYGSNYAGTYSIDTATSQTGLISDFRNQYSGSGSLALTYGDGVLYGSNYAGTYSIDAATGQTELVSDFRNQYSDSGLALIYGDGVLYGSNYAGTYSIDTATGQTELVSDFRNQYSGSLALAYSPVPIPAAAWLFGSALVGLAGLKRKSKT